MDGIPYSFLAFHLNIGKDEKQVLRVELKGEFIRIPDGIVNVKVNGWYNVCGILDADKFFTSRVFGVCRKRKRNLLKQPFKLHPRHGGVF